MATTLESLEVEVKYKASGAEAEIAKVTAQIQAMGEALKSVLPDLREYAKALGKIGNSVKNPVKEKANPLPLEMQDTIPYASEIDVLKSKLVGLSQAMQDAMNKGDAGKAFDIRGRILKTADALERAQASAQRAEQANRGFSWSMKQVSQEAIKTKSPLENFAASLKRIAFYRIIRSIIKNIGQAFSEGLEKAYLFSQGMSDEGHRFAEALDSMKSASNQMKGQLGAAFLALLTAVQPILEAIINLIIKVADAITQLLSAFTGTKYLKANNTAAQFADNMKKGAGAAKEWKNQLLGFDEINRLNEPSNGGGGGGTNPLEGYDMVSADISEFWLKVAEKLKPIIQDIKDMFGGLRDFIVGVFTGDWELAFEGLGKIVEGFGSLVNHVLNGLVIPMFDGFAAKVIERVDGLLQHIEETTGVDLTKIREGVAYALNYIRFLLEGFAIQASWIIQDLCETISALLRGDWDAAWEGAGKIVQDATVDVRTEADVMARVVSGAMMAGGNASADFAEAFSANMETARGQLAAMGNSSLTVSESQNGISFAARIANFVGKILRIGSFVPAMFAEGGFPTEGQLFIARENGAGAELVGNIGGRTGVASNNDILNGIREGVYEAVTAANNNGNNDVSVRVYLDSKEIKAGQQRLNRAWGVG